MKNEKEKLDLLLDRNVAEQFAKVDWGKLVPAISGRLDKVAQTSASAIRRRTALKIAGGLAAAAAVVFIFLMIRPERPSHLQLGKGESAVVKFIDKKGIASVKIGPEPAKSNVWVDVRPSRRDLAKCDVQIIDVGQDQAKNGNRAAWIIITRPQPVYADNGLGRDMTAVLNLF